LLLHVAVMMYVLEASVEVVNKVVGANLELAVA
jgi:hypothetical protein